MFNPDVFKNIEDSVLTKEDNTKEKVDSTISEDAIQAMIQKEWAKMKEQEATKEEQEVTKEEPITDNTVEVHGVTTTKDSNQQEGGNVMLDNIKVTLEGKLAVLSNDGFHYSINDDGSMKREYTILENISKPLIRQRVTLNTGDTLIYDGELCFCGSVGKNKYEITRFSDKSMLQIQKGDESDELGDTYEVVINPLESILETDKTADVLTLLANNAANAPAINLALQREQGNALTQLSKYIIGGGISNTDK